mgnify:FL=1
MAKGDVPIPKQAGMKDVHNFRPISLLSVFSKIYAKVLERRLQSWCDEHGILQEEQNGFRKERSTLDHIFSLTEIIRLRRSRQESTVLAYIDVEKAYDSVWRKGLWKVLLKMGVTGKMFRVLKNMYREVESAVVCDAKSISNWFTVESGVRQGCVLSPLLFNIFINGVVSAMEDHQCGIEIGESESKLAVLLYADDIVLLAKNSDEMKLMLNDLQAYFVKWQLNFNFSKSVIVKYGRCHEAIFEIDGRSIAQKDVYKYLGVEISARIYWNQTRGRLLAKVKERMARLWAIGSKTRQLSVEAQCNIWRLVLKPMLEYGSEMWGNTRWMDAERMQYKMARMILGAKLRTNVEVLLGELGWRSMRAYRDVKRLTWWHKLLCMHERRLPRVIYELEKRAFEKSKAMIPVPKVRNSWCEGTFEVLKKYGLEKYWNHEMKVKLMAPGEWKKEVKKKVADAEERIWRLRLSGHSKLKKYYETFKGVAGLESYLSSSDIDGRRMLFFIRSGSNDLGVDAERGKCERNERICKLCLTAVEDEEHFVLQCSLYQVERSIMLACVKKRLNMQSWRVFENEKLMEMLCSSDDVEIQVAVMKYLKQAFYKRSKLLKEVM